MSVHTLFSTVVQATVFGSVVGIIIFALKFTLLRKLAAKWQYWLWSVFIIKLIYPKGPESKISVFNQIDVAKSISETDLISIAYKPQYIGKTQQIQETFNIEGIIPYVWATGFVIAILWTVISFVVLKYRIRTSSSAAPENVLQILEQCKNTAKVRKNIEVVVQKHISSTALCGIFKPQILITEGFTHSDVSHMEYTFLHELSHYKRGDIAVNYLLIFLRCVHWFNPAIWFLFSKIRRDTEIATDERTMLYLKPDEHKSYGMTLINAISLQSAKSPKLLGMANTKHDITKRVKAIAKFKKPGFIHHMSGVITVILIASVSLTSAAAAQPMAEKILETLPKVSEPFNAIIKEPEPIIEVTPAVAQPIPETPTPAIVETQKLETEVPTVPEPVTDVQSNNISEIENFDNRNIDNLIKLTGQVIDNENVTTDLTKYAKMVYYNTDYDGAYTFNVKPNEQGYIQFFVENEGYNHSVYIGIYHIDSKGRGWDYCFNTGTKAPIYLDGYEPGEEYVVTLYCYCPGYYDINGRILVY